MWQSTVNNVLIGLLWTLRQQCVWRSTIAVVYKPRIDNNRWKLWQSIGRTSDIHKQMTHSVKQGSLLSCVIDQPTEALINHIDQFGQPCQIRSIHNYSRFTIIVWSLCNVFVCVIRKCSFHRCHEDREYLWRQFNFLSHHQVESSLRLKLAKRLWSAHAGAPFLNISLLALIGVQRFTCNCPWK